MPSAHDIDPGNGADRHDPPCNELRFVERRVDSQDQRIANHLAKLDRTMGQVLAAAGEAAENATHAARDAARAANAAERTDAKFSAPANDLLAKYQSDPPELLDADEDNIPTSTSIRVPALAEKRIRKEQQRSTRAVKQRNWMAVGLAIGGTVAGILEALRLAGILK